MIELLFCNIILHKTIQTAFIRNTKYAKIYGLLDFVHRPVFEKLENTIIRKLYLFPASDAEIKHVLC
jgi:hypothetical protein